MSETKHKETIVVKFGGSVLEDEKSIGRAARMIQEIQRSGTDVIVVASAMKGVTDNLLSLSKGVNPNMDASLVDELLSSGEKTSVRLVAAALSNYGIKSRVLDPDTPEWPIITDGRHMDADPLMDVTRERTRDALVPALERGEVPVVCGFLGRTLDGKTTTLGRGGSDTTAVVLGNCLSAKEVVLIKDVEGVYSSDPDRVSNPLFIESLDGEEAEMLAAGGAKFLHLKALRYQTPGLKIRVTSLEKLDSGTVIHGDLPELYVEVANTAASMITVVGIDSNELDSIANVARAIRNAGAMILALSLEAKAGVFYVTGGTAVLDAVHQVLIHGKLGKAASSFDGLAMIAVRGRALETHPGVVQRVTQPLARSGINLYGLVTILSSVRVFVSNEQAQKALRLIKEALMVVDS